MTRITFALAVLCLAAPQSAPETKFTVHVEEVEATDIRPVKAGQDRPRTVLDPRPDEKLVRQFDVQAVPGRGFRARTKDLHETRELSGVFQPDQGERFRLDVDYSVVIANADGQSSRRVNTQVSLKSGQRTLLAGRENNSTAETRDGALETRSVYSVWVTLLEVKEGR